MGRGIGVHVQIYMTHRVMHWVEYDVLRNRIWPLHTEADTWCSTSSFMGNGTLIRTSCFGHGSQRIRSYPSTGSSVILPLSHTDRFERVEVMICGGASSDAYSAAQHGRFLPGLTSCGRMEITGAETWLGAEKGLINAHLEALLNPNVAPAGYYMLTVVNYGIPSVSQWVRFIHA
ncbi:unnamed protein product [Fraxinus pennsylvanica]|uniref:Galactose oxidase-like Early set domain-containing protein n=1 Tax=Fraxinus pennsylvanica TaxID=56036 RepID=A0AAD1YU94_9LAMI|nr:unnamed protein product [Fraxinus pennsylvanica]